MKLYNEDMQVALNGMLDNSVDSIITDPPYGINFMKKQWDYDVPSVDMWKQCLRVLKPGGHLLSFSSPRTYHRMVINIEDAGFEVRDQIMWAYNSGFPKSHNIGKAYDKKYDRSREIVGSKTSPDMRSSKATSVGGSIERGQLTTFDTSGDGPFEGWGTALKPAHEPIVVCRKPLSEKTVMANMERWGTGGLNIDQSRIPFEDGEVVVYHSVGEVGNFAGRVGKETTSDKNYHSRTEGRWPANLIHDGLWNDKDHGKFYFVPKVSKRERNEGLETLNTHPTVKPIDLMFYLIRMVTYADGTVLDPFMGSGSTGCAAVANGFNFIGVEMEESSYKIAQTRINYFKK